jgi:hypothetical protein
VRGNWSNFYIWLLSLPDSINPVDKFSRHSDNGFSVSSPFASFLLIVGFKLRIMDAYDSGSKE